MAGTTSPDALDPEARDPEAQKAGNKMLVGEHRGDFNESAATDGSAMRPSGSGRAPNPHASLLFRVVTGIVAHESLA